MLYDVWHVLRLAGPVRRVAPVDLVDAPLPAVPPTGAVPSVVTVHDAAPLVMPEAFTRRGVTFHRQGFAAVAKRARLVIAVSEFSADEIATHTAIPRAAHPGRPQRRRRRAATPTAIDEARRAFGIDDRPYVFWAGTFQPRKNVRVLLDAFAGSTPTRCRTGSCSPARRAGSRTTPTRWPPVRSVTVCGCSARSPASTSSRCSPGPTCSTFPSRHEGFGIPVAEAMAQGTAVVCVGHPGAARGRR